MRMNRETVTELRGRIEQQLLAGSWHEARLLLEDLWRREPDSATARYINAGYARMSGAHGYRNSRVAILRSFTVEPLVPILEADSLVEARLDLNVFVGEFNAYAQEMLDPNGSLYQFRPDAVILAVQTRDIAPRLWQGFPELSAADVDEAIAEVLSTFRQLIHAFRQHGSGSLIVHNFEEPAFRAQGVLDALAPTSQTDAIRRLNRELKKLCGEFPGVHVLDYNALVARHGRLAWNDERRWMTVRFPISADCLRHMAREWVRLLHALLGTVKKVLVTDLDNTLWKGVIGEDGMDGIRLDDEYPGAIYRRVQLALLDLYHRGILLAVSSKNNEADARAVLEKHPDMLLGAAHFSAMRCNWNDKARSLREIAAELNVGAESLVFLDDNPAERQRIRMEMPDVTVIPLPENAAGFEAAVRECPVFERVALSAEDRERHLQYAQQRQRRAAVLKAATVEEYYCSLQQVVEIGPVTADVVPRAAQLTQKTNQFNLTTRRYSETDIRNFAGAASSDVYVTRVRDRFGDNGVVGVCIVIRNGDVMEIDTMLLSCRVIGRTVETAVLSHIVDQAREAGIRRLRGRFIPTKKNKPAADFYRSHNFRKLAGENGSRLWELDVTAEEVRCPEWIRIESRGGGTRELAYS